MAGRLWTHEEVELLKQLRGEGKSIRECANVLGRSHVSVRDKWYNGLAGKTKRPRPWTDAEVRRLEQLRAEGKTIQQCADILGRTYGAVQSKLCKLRSDCRSSPAMRRFIALLTYARQEATIHGVKPDMDALLEGFREGYFDGIRFIVVERECKDA